jgi:hypothetical protein
VAATYCSTKFGCAAEERRQESRLFDREVAVTDISENIEILQGIKCIHLKGAMLFSI